MLKDRKFSSAQIAIGLVIFNIAFYMLFPMPGFRRWDGLMTATTIAHFSDTPWQVILFFAHTLIIPITQFFNWAVPPADPLVITAFREVCFSALNVVIIYLFFRHYLKKDLPALLLAMAYIFCHAHWQFTTGGEEKDSMLILNMVYLIGFFQFKGWLNLNIEIFKPHQPNTNSPQSWVRRMQVEIILGIVLAVSIMIHLENGLLVITTIIMYLMRKNFYRNFRTEFSELMRIMTTAGVLLLIWFSIVLFGINRITSMSGVLRWLMEYHATGEFFNTDIHFTDQFVWAYQGFRRFLVGKHFEHEMMGLEAIAATMIAVILLIRSYRHAPRIIGMTLIYIGLLTAHFFFWLPWDPEQWNPVVFCGFIVLSPAVFTTRSNKPTLVACGLVAVLAMVNFGSYHKSSEKYRPIVEQNILNNSDRVKGFNGLFLRNIPYANLAQLVAQDTKPGALIFLDQRHLANHLLIYSDLIPIIIRYLDKDDELLRNEYYLSQLSMHFYKPPFTQSEINLMLQSGREAYYLTNRKTSVNYLQNSFSVDLEIIQNFNLNNFRLYKLNPVQE